MSTRRKIIIVACIALAVLLVAYVVIMLLGAKNQIASVPQNQEKEQSTDVFSGANSDNFYVPSKNDKEIEIKTPEGTIAINNVYKEEISSLSEGGVSFRDNNDYYIAYYPQDQGFIIAMESPDIQKARQEAETDFIEMLGITKEQACNLRVSLTVPVSVNEKASGDNYGLSFCPNGKPFPN